MNNYLNIFFAKILLPILLGVALALSFAPFAIFPLAVAAPAGLLWLWRNALPKQAFWSGFWFGIGLFGAGVYWIFHSIHYFGGIPNLFALFTTAGLIAILALFPAITGYLFKRYFLQATPASFICGFPAVWVLMEWIRSWIFSGFAWLFVGYSQTGSPLKGYAAILSVYGVSLAVLITSGCLVNSIIEFKQKNYRSLYFSLFGIVAIWLSGSLLSLIPWTSAQGRPLTVSLVQGNIPQALKWSPEHLQLSLNRYEELTQPLWGKSDLIIWPEAAIPLPFKQASSFLESMDEKAKKSNTTLILGIPTEADDGRNFNNTVVTLGKNHQQYSKRRLVPFGEYLPFYQYLIGIFDKLNIPVSDIVPGKFAQSPIVVNNVKMLTAICYEITFPELAYTNDPNLGFILTVTNDAWFGKSSAQAQHLQMAQMRAQELGRSVVFVSNDGITAIISADGTIQDAAPPHQIYILTSKVQPMSGITPWMRNGMDPLLFILLCLFFTAVNSERRLKKQLANQEKTQTQMNQF